MQKKHLKFSNPLKRKIFKLDEKSDIAYIKIARQRYPTGGINVDNNILLDVEGKTGRIIGFTILDYSKFLKSAKQEREVIHNRARESMERIVKVCENNFSIPIPESLIRFTLHNGR